MNRGQASHARSMASKIRGHAQHMSMRMKNLMEASDEDFKHVPVENVESVFKDLEHDWKNIERVKDDMLTDLRQEERANE